MTDLDGLRYPIGRFTPPAGNSPELRAEQIETLRLLPERIAAAVNGLAGAQFDTPYREGGWTVRQVVHHVADSHAMSYTRFKMALTEDSPTIKPYDEAAWANLADSRLPVDVSIGMIAAVHVRLVALLESLSDADFAKPFLHPERGPMTLAANLAMYDWHSRHHTAHIADLRTRQGW